MGKERKRKKTEYRGARLYSSFSLDGRAPLRFSKAELYVRLVSGTSFFWL